MRHWLASIIGVLLVLITAACQQAPQLESRDEQSTATAQEGDRVQKPPAEEVEKLTSKLESRDESAFLEAWPPGLERLIGEEAVKAIMAPEDSVVTMSDPMWSDAVGCWTVDVTIEAPDGQSVERTTCLVLLDDQWYISGSEVSER